MKLASVLVFVFSVTQAGFAQDDTSTSKPEIEPDLRVQVKLNNGAFITGIAKEGRLIERLKRGGFRSLADKKDPHSGIRVWNYRRTIGYIFLKYRTVEVVKVLGVLTQEEKRLLEESLARAAEVRAPPSPSTPESAESSPGPATSSPLRSWSTPTPWSCSWRGRRRSSGCNPDAQHTEQP